MNITTVYRYLDKLEKDGTVIRYASEQGGQAAYQYVEQGRGVKAIASKMYLLWKGYSPGLCVYERNLRTYPGRSWVSAPVQEFHPVWNLQGLP